MTEFRGSTMLITGAASGLGRLLAERGARAGAALVLWDLNAEGVRAAASSLEAAGARVHAAAVDVSDRARVYAAAAEARAALGPVDILVNNAGIVTGRLLLDSPDESIQATFGVNTLALYWTTKAFLPDMIARGRGHIVTIASAAGLVGVVRQTDYAASKHAAVGFDESLRYELARIAPAVRTTLVCPFYVDTGMFAGAKSRFPRLLPILKEAAVADRIMRAIRRNERRLMMPPLVRLLPAMRILPAPLFDRMMDFFGVNSSMDDFVGRAPHD
jgi:all-trans-retinol dehydrogenase (NAD+)